MNSKIAIALMLVLSCVVGFSVGWTLEKRHDKSQNNPRAEERKSSPERSASKSQDPAVFNVDYSKSINQLVIEASFDMSDVDSVANDRHFSKERNSGRADLGFALIRTDKPMTVREITGEMDKAGLRPATLKELLAFARAFPEKQRESAIGEIGSIGEDAERCPIVVFISNYEKTRVLCWDYAFEKNLFGGKEDQDTYFLAIAK